MAEERLNNIPIKTEFEQVMQTIQDGHNFLLSGGAGSGKTYSLVEIVRQVLIDNPTEKIACITYTNSAVKEIEERVNARNLVVSTIHDFLWDSIKRFQKEIKASLINIINDAECKLSIRGVTSLETDYYKKVDEIQYKEYVRLTEGIISHDEVIVLAEYMFNKYPKLCDIIKDRYKYIFVDEYQDTHLDVVKILLEHFGKSDKKCIIGFFGDSMQSIYDDGVGDIVKYVDIGKVVEVIKVCNRRNPQAVINLANKLRFDSVIQEPSSDIKAPNMNVDGSIKQGDVVFMYSSDVDVIRAREYLTQAYSWNFNESKHTKELNLTHNLIAVKAGFKTLYDIYDKDPILSLRNEINTKIKSGALCINIEENDTFDDVVNKAMLKNRKKQLKKDVLCSDQTHNALYNCLKGLPFKVVKQIYVTKDQLIDDKKQDSGDESRKGSKRDNLIKHLFKIETAISLYQNKQYAEFIRLTGFKKVRSVYDKQKLKEHIELLTNTSGGTNSIGDVIYHADSCGICKLGEDIEAYMSTNEYIYNRVIKVEYSEFRALYKYLEGYTPYSTQHKTKGDEFDNVFVILDNGRWNDYNFNNLFVGGGNRSVEERTKKIFYVCCTRAKEKLAVYYHSPSQQVINIAKNWFNGNVIDLDNL